MLGISDCLRVIFWCLKLIINIVDDKIWLFYNKKNVSLIALIYFLIRSELNVYFIDLYAG